MQFLFSVFNILECHVEMFVKILIGRSLTNNYQGDNFPCLRMRIAISLTTKTAIFTV